MSDPRRVRREATARETTYSDAEDVRGPLWEEAVTASAGRGALVPAADDAEDAPLAADDVSGNLRRYARWQWRDFWRTRGGWLSLGAMLGVWLITYIAGHGRTMYVGGVFRHGPMEPQDLSAMAHAAFALGGAAAALLGVGGLVSRERERGLQRFLFAKPVRPVRYYLQLLAVNSAGALTVLLGAVLLAAALIGSAMPVGTVMALGVGAYVITAGVTFLMSTLVRFDAPIAAAWLLAGFPVLAAAKNGVPGTHALLWLFPQGPANAIVDALAPRSGEPTPNTLLVMGALIVLLAVFYGLAGFIGGVSVLRRRSIST